MKSAILLTVAGVVGLATVALIAEETPPPPITPPPQSMIPPGSKVLYFHNGMGTVKFNHDLHAHDVQYTILSDCNKCHGKPGEPLPANLFPQKYDDKKSIMKQAHETCKGCHKEVNQETSEHPANTHPQAPYGDKCFNCHTGEEPAHQP